MPPGNPPYYGGGGDIHSSGYRDRYAPPMPPGGSMDWNRNDRGEYGSHPTHRREYDRRPPANS